MSVNDNRFDDDALARDVVAFFGLPPGWTEVDLRRAYTRLIRRWKPEKFPEEFKKIHTAYLRLRQDSSTHKPSPETNRVEPAGTIEVRPENAVPALAKTEKVTPNPPPPRPPREPRHLPVEDNRPATILLNELGRSVTRGILEGRRIKTGPDLIALAFLRGDVARWPGVCLSTLLEAIGFDDWGEGEAPASAVLYHVVSIGRPEDAREALDALRELESHPQIYFDHSAVFWDAFARSNPEACAMRLNRTVFFTPLGKTLPAKHFILRFGISHATRMPMGVLREWADFLNLHGKGFEDQHATWKVGGYRHFSPHERNASIVAMELNFFESLLRIRADLESAELAAHPSATEYREVISAYLDGNPERLLAAWTRLSSKTGDTFLPWRTSENSATRVFMRIREEMDALLSTPSTPSRFMRMAAKALIRLFGIAPAVAWVSGGIASFTGLIVLICYLNDLNERTLQWIVLSTIGGIFCAVGLFNCFKKSLTDRCDRMACHLFGIAMQRGKISRQAARYYLWQRGSKSGERLVPCFDKRWPVNFRSNLFDGTRR